MHARTQRARAQRARIQRRHQRRRNRYTPDAIDALIIALFLPLLAAGIGAFLANYHNEIAAILRNI